MVTPSQASSLAALVDDADVDAGDRQAVAGEQVEALLVRQTLADRAFSDMTVAMGVVSVMPQASMNWMPYFVAIQFDELARQCRSRAHDIVRRLEISCGCDSR